MNQWGSNLRRYEEFSEQLKSHQGKFDSHLKSYNDHLQTWQEQLDKLSIDEISKSKQQRPKISRQSDKDFILENKILADRKGHLRKVEDMVAQSNIDKYGISPRIQANFQKIN